MKPQTVHAVSSLVLLVVLTLAFAWIVLPFYGAVLWAVILAILFNPLHRRIEASVAGRRNLAAALTLFVCLLIVLIPARLLLSSLTTEATALYRQVTGQQIDLTAILTRVQESLPSFLTDALAAVNLTTVEEIQAQLNAFIGQVTQFFATQILTIGQTTVQFVVGLGIMLYLLFFMFRDGDELDRAIRRASPLSRGYTDFLCTKFTDVIRATVQGNVIIAIVQGSIGGITFWLLDLPSPQLWGVVMGVLALLPVLGATLVWGPVALYLLAVGEFTRGAILLGVGVLLIATIDNLLRPPLVGRGSRLPDYVVLLSTLGGISVLGMNGFVVGPLIAALCLAAWSQFGRDRAG